MKALLTVHFLLLFTVISTAEDIADGSKVAFLGLTFIDTSTEGAYNGVRADESARLGLLEDLVATRFVEEGMTLLDLAPISKQLESTANPASCYGCEIRMAKKLDADLVVVGVVQKVSNLIIAMNLVMRDVRSGKVVRGRSVEVRSNTDQSWSRGMRYILKTAFFKP